MKYNDIIFEAEKILENKSLERTFSYNQDPRYHEINGAYFAAVKAQNWKKAHDLLVCIEIIKQRFQLGEWVVNGDWV